MNSALYGDGGIRLTRCTPHCTTCLIGQERGNKTCPHEEQVRSLPTIPKCSHWEPIPKPTKTMYLTDPNQPQQQELNLWQR